MFVCINSNASIIYEKMVAWTSPYSGNPHSDYSVRLKLINFFDFAIMVTRNIDEEAFTCFFFFNDNLYFVTSKMRSAWMSKSHKVSGFERYHFYQTSYFVHRRQCRWEASVSWRLLYSFCTIIIINHNTSTAFSKNLKTANAMCQIQKWW